MGEKIGEYWVEKGRFWANNWRFLCFAKFHWSKNEAITSLGQFFGNKSQRIWPILNEQLPPNSRFKKRIGCWVKKGVGDKRSEGERERKKH